MTDRDTPGPAPETAPARDYNENDLASIAAGLPDDAFELDDDRDPASGTENPAAEPEGEPERPRDAAGRFAQRPQAAEGDEPEPEGDAAGPEAETADAGAEPEEPAGQPKPPERNTVTIDGHEIPVEEVRRGFMRQADYTQKTQALADRRREIEARAQRLDQDMAQNAAILELATEIIRPHLIQKPPRSLIETDFLAYQAQLTDYNEQQERLAQLVQTRQHLGQRQQAEREQAEQARARETQTQTAAQRAAALDSLERAFPEFRKPEDWTGFFSEVDAYGRKNGFTVQELLQAPDPRTFAIVRKAMAYDKLQADKKAAVDRVRSAPPIRPATRQGPGTRSGAPAQTARDAFRRDPTIEGAMAALPDSAFGLD